jgi:DNA-binding transcriptional ArsR family regulator
MRLSDPKAIRALSHPVRLDLMELLMAISPATAARCGRILGVSQATCSFHLRQLAKYGFVEDAGPGNDRRERLWQPTEARYLLSIDDGIDPLVAREFERVAVAREAQAFLDYLSRRDEEPAPWREGGGALSTVVALSADEAHALKQQWRELIAPYITRTEDHQYRPQPGQRLVRYFHAAAPLPAIDLTEAPDD